MRGGGRLTRLREWVRALSPQGKTSLASFGFGVAYGLLARIVMGTGLFGELWGVMTLGFFLVVPFVLGVITVRGTERPSMWFRIFGPWVPVLMVVGGTFVLGLEGMTCAVMALPFLLVISSIGGAVTSARPMRSRATFPALLALPYIVAPLEQTVAPPNRFRETITEIEIAAPPAVVWPFVTSVDSIRPEEQRPALYLALGLPKPISATLSHPGVGGVRSARFQHGLVFTETVTEWVLERRLSFTIDPNTTSLPPTALDTHVTVGGPHFDVMTGTYELHPLDGGRRTRLVLRSTHRLSTRFNLYAGWWTDRIMSSIQAHISEVHKTRAESAPRYAAPAPGR